MTEVHLLVAPANIMVTQIQENTLLRLRALTDTTLKHLLAEVILRIGVNKHIKVRDKDILTDLVVTERYEKLPALREHILCCKTGKALLRECNIIDDGIARFLHHLICRISATIPSDTDDTLLCK